eukprot:GSMAST32.ASY1.ANO1.1745.1 assembled CDS
MADRLEVAGRQLQERDRIRQQLKKQEEEKAELDAKEAAIEEYKRQYEANAKERFERCNPDIIERKKELQEVDDDVIAQERAQEREKKKENEELDDSEEAVLRRMRAKRMRELRAKQQRRKQGYGDYREIIESEFLQEACNAEFVAVHFYHREFVRCKVMDKHLERISRAHDTVKILKLNAEKAPFFVNKLGIKILPTVIMFKNGVSCDRITGFERVLGDDKCTSMFQFQFFFQQIYILWLLIPNNYRM